MNTCVKEALGPYSDETKVRVAMSREVFAHLLTAAIHRRKPAVRSASIGMDLPRR